MENLENEFLKIAVSSLGAELSSIYNKKKNQEFLWSGDAAWWPRRAPVLFPIVGKVNKGIYRVNGQGYALPQHGFARDCEFEFAGRTENSVAFTLRSSPATLLKYPFEFELTVSYMLQGRNLTVGYKVSNIGQQRQLFSIGAHPAFALTPGEKLSDYYVEFDQPETLDRHLLIDGIFSGETERVITESTILELNDELVRKDAIVLKGMRSTRVTLKSRVSAYHLEVARNDFPVFGIWAKPAGPFVCLEPWDGFADDHNFTGEFSEKVGILNLDPGNVLTREFSVTIR